MPAGADLIAGHIAYSSLRQRFPDAQFITVLREPVSRLPSHWLYWRNSSDEQLVPWGPWADRVRQSRLRLVEFLSSRLVACQLDNVMVRMLLWPHRLIPLDDFINLRHDRRLLAEARDRLAEFALAEVVENPAFADRLQEWLGHPFAPERRNETGCVPEPLRRPLAGELTPEAVDLLALRSRLDLELWPGAARPGAVCLVAIPPNSASKRCCECGPLRNVDGSVGRTPLERFRVDRTHIPSSSLPGATRQSAATHATKRAVAPDGRIKSIGVRFESSGNFSSLGGWFYS